MKKAIAMLFALLLIISVPVYAGQRRAADVYPSLTFTSGVATCVVDITSDNPLDAISATMELWRGGIKLNDWSTYGYGDISMQETASVTRNKTYTLVINYSINNVAKPSVSINRYYG